MLHVVAAGALNGWTLGSKKGFGVVEIIRCVRNDRLSNQCNHCSTSCQNIVAKPSPPPILTL